MSEMRRVYPAVFERDPRTGFGVSIPDLHAYADGNDFEEAITNAKKAANAALCRLCSRKAAIPDPSSPTEIELNPGEQIYALEIDVMRRRVGTTESRTKTAAVPVWFNDKANKSGVRETTTSFQESLTLR